VTDLPQEAKATGVFPRRGQNEMRTNKGLGLCLGPEKPQPSEVGLGHHYIASRTASALSAQSTPVFFNRSLTWH
jgi:hypothetical protein